MKFADITYIHDEIRKRNFDHKYIESISDEVKKIVFAPAPKYHMGMWESIKTNNFSLQAAFEHNGIREVSKSHFKGELGPSTGASGVSNPNNNTFAVEPRSMDKIWQYTVLHEAGHLFLKHRATEFDQIFRTGKIEFHEMEAVSFGYILGKKLGIDLPVKLIAWQVANYMGQFRNYEEFFNQEEFERIEKEVDKFLKSGRQK